MIDIAILILLALNAGITWTMIQALLACWDATKVVLDEIEKRIDEAKRK